MSVTVKASGLVPGKVDPEHFEAVLSFTGIRGENLVAALRWYFVDGLSQRDAVQKTGVNQSLLSRKTAVVEAMSDRLLSASKHYRYRA